MTTKTSRPRFNASDDRCVMFAHYVANHCTQEQADGSSNAHHLAALCSLIRRAAKAGERACNVPGVEKAYERATLAVEKYARERHGWSTQWPGLYPTFTKASGESINCPPL